MSYYTALCFDVGLKRTGVASGHSLTKSANPAGLLEVSDGQLNWDEVDKLLKKWQPGLVVVGDPMTSNHQLPKVINRLKHHIQSNHKIPIVMVDERLSSNSANQRLAHEKLSKEKKTELRDQIAACIILESYFNSLA